MHNLERKLEGNKVIYTDLNGLLKKELRIFLQIGGFNFAADPTSDLLRPAFSIISNKY